MTGVTEARARQTVVMADFEVHFDPPMPAPEAWKRDGSRYTTENSTNVASWSIR